MIEIHTIKDRDDWLKMRRRDITGSEVGALFGVHRYKTPAQLYAEKIGAVEEDGGGSKVMTRGVRLEGFVAQQIQLQHPEFTVRKAQHYYRDPLNRLGGTPDFELEHSDGRTGILEIKTVGATDFKNIWRAGDPEGAILPEAWQMLQVLQYMYLTGATFGLVGVLPVSEWASMDVHVVHIPRREEVIERMKLESLKFWGRVADGVPPDFKWEKDLDTIKALYGSAEKGKCINLQWDEEFTQLLDRRETLKGIVGGTRMNLEAVEAQIRAKIGDAETALGNGWSVSLSNTHREGYTVKPTDYRTLRAKRERVLESA